MDKIYLEFTEAEHSRHKRHQYCNESTGTFQNMSSDCGSLFKQKSNDCLTLLDHMLTFHPVLLIHSYWNKKMR